MLIIMEKGEISSYLMHTCINHTASLSALDIASYTAAPSSEIYAGLLFGGEFSLNVSLQTIEYWCQQFTVRKYGSQNFNNYLHQSNKVPP